MYNIPDPVYSSFPDPVYNISDAKYNIPESVYHISDPMNNIPDPQIQVTRQPEIFMITVACHAAAMKTVSCSNSYQYVSEKEYSNQDKG